MSLDLRKWGVRPEGAGAPAPAPSLSEADLTRPGMQDPSPLQIAAKKPCHYPYLSGYRDRRPKPVFKNFWETFLGPTLQRDGEALATRDALNMKRLQHVAVVLGASWSKPLAALVPKLAALHGREDAWYETVLKEKYRSIEVVYVAGDKDEAAFDASVKEMPWLVVPFATARDVKKKLSRVLNVGSNPGLEVVLLTGKGARDKGESPFAPRVPPESPPPLFLGGRRRRARYAKHAKTLVDLQRQVMLHEARILKQDKAKLAACAAWPPPPVSNDPNMPYFLSDETVEAQIAKGKPRAPWEGGPHPWSFRDGVVPPNFGVRPAESFPGGVVPPNFGVRDAAEAPAPAPAGAAS